MQRNTLIFDLDGTIAHTAPDLIATLNRVTAQLDIPAVDLSQVNQIVGHGAKAMLKRAFDLAGRSVSEEDHEQLFQAFLKDYTLNIANETYIFDGLLNAMDSLENKGFSFCVCTNKMEDMARVLLKELSIDNRFKALSGGNTFPFRKPDGRHLKETVALFGQSINTAIMIGDSSTDINAAIDAGIPSIAVTFGYTDVPAVQLGATKVISHFDELEDTIMLIA
ncbi:MAG: HAD hydrolase-like protein [Pseudomonadota bacterium]